MQTEAFEIVEVSLSFFEVFAVLLNGLESITVATIHFPLKRMNSNSENYLFSITHSLL